MHEHPEGARSWADEHVAKIVGDPRVGSVVGHQCQYGQTAVTDEGERIPARKATRWMSSAPELLKRLGLRCRGGHWHQHIVGGRAAAAAIYPSQLCKAILRGAEAQRRREGRPLPEQVMRELAILGLSEPEASAADGQPAHVHSAADGQPVRACVAGGAGLGRRCTAKEHARVCEP